MPKLIISMRSITQCLEIDKSHYDGRRYIIIYIKILFAQDDGLFPFANTDLASY